MTVAELRTVIFNQALEGALQYKDAVESGDEMMIIYWAKHIEDRELFIAALDALDESR
jgi:hypothetical protein